MPATEFLRHHWPAIIIGVTAAAIACAAVAMLGNMPPHRIVMATGPEGEAYYRIGERYREALARENVEVQLVATAGSVGNLALLRDARGGASAALIEGGIPDVGDISQLESLGTVFYEPLWWFQKRGVRVEGIESLLGRKLSIGEPGSGTRALTQALIQRTGMEGKFGELLAFAPQTARDKLLAGEIDAAFIMTPWESPTVQQLLADERVALAGFTHADAFVALFPFLNKVLVPRGVVNIPDDRPPANVVLIATRASLVVRKDVHPAIQYLLLNAAVKIHSAPSIFHPANAFPAAEAIDIPLSDEAIRFYKSGLPFLHDHFPFWMAALLGKLAVLLIPILGLLYPMTRILPRLYDWAMRSKVLRLYGELRFLEDEMTSARNAGHDTREMTERLDRLQEQANRLRVPLAYASMLYMLRHHIDLVREGLRKPVDRTMP